MRRRTNRLGWQSWVSLAVMVGPAWAGRVDLAKPGVMETLTGPQAGEPSGLATAFARSRATELGMTASDFEEFRLVDSYRSKHNGLTHVYLRQRHNGIEVWNGDIAVHVAADGSILRLHSQFANDLASSICSSAVVIDAADAVELAARHLGLELSGPVVVEQQFDGPAREVVFSPAGISLDSIPCRLMYFEAARGVVRLAWNLRIYAIDARNWWNLLIDVETGAVLAKDNWVDSETYQVYELPAASPNHVTPLPPADGRTVVVNRADPTASPSGWHSTTTTPGQYQTSRGNNVDAYEDQDNSNDPTGGDAARAAGGASLVFNFPIDHLLAPDTYVDAATTNLFYVNNAIHDISYRYGFDEASGNFQVNNFGRGGDGNDDVQAECQDGGGRNNANFSTPEDGMRPRMQMYVWDPASNDRLTVHTPASIARDYTVRSAAFGPPVPLLPGVTGNLVLVDDGSAIPAEGCGALINGAAVNGNIAMAEFGSFNCDAGMVAVNAEAVGATALILLANDPRIPLYSVVGSGSPTIPTVLVLYSDGNLLRAQTPVPGVNGTLINPGGSTVVRDGDLDTEIIIHEYTHGISNRLVGGRLNVGCLGNSEQAGEGWSDLLGLMLTVKPGDIGPTLRGLATYSTFQDPSGPGLRPYPYSTDLAFSPLTYAAIATQAVPHGVGAVWAAMGWEVYWAMTERYGFDPDLINGNAGNNLAIQLIFDGMKLVPCSPGFVDDRDAILQADQVNNAGANRCLLWQAFAKRGLGFSARQGTNGVGDETEAFDLPANCMCAPPVELGNVLKAWRSGRDVELDFPGAVGARWRLFRDNDKRMPRTTPLPPDVVVTHFSDVGGVDQPSHSFYRITEVDCLGSAGP